MNGQDLLNRFYLDDDRVFHKQVESVSAINQVVLVFDGQLFLSFDRDAAGDDLVKQTGLVRGFAL